MSGSSRGTVLAGRADVALIAARVVEPGHEESFRQWARDVLAAAAEAPGNLGGGLFHPAEDGAPWIFVHRFRDHGTLQGWIDSPQRAEFFAPHEGHRHTEVARRELTGLEGWIADPGSLAATPPRWKMAASSALGIFPVSLLGSAFLTPHLKGLPQVARTAVFAALFSVLMTYAAMPAVTRILRRWLSPGTPITQQ
ncbi:antibiotic biosynthesis monooxygenase [Streptomyces antarcticus]|uniref:antibiotic biosynthesis monooxygenase n=1 Tax=Streptomyces antarcticus TaxID=2996458 RepID=UPI0022709488|nr:MULTISPECIES: antibiotic biosynthesis monooxygenase [unclassified Streptomyces]MCY0939782.1 antibiotic biosynthesis monooxygenase [Streptomyces sp. H34-AA3]MCZ4080952.1 antibiotic biosynthesis monooxygenase [Streptomyces sp. H34-S5]